MLTFATLGKLRREPTTRCSITILPLYGGQEWGPWQTDPRLLGLTTGTWNLTFILTKWSQAHLNAPLGLWNRPPGEGLDCVLVWSRPWQQAGLDIHVSTRFAACILDLFASGRDDCFPVALDQRMGTQPSWDAQLWSSWQLWCPTGRLQCSHGHGTLSLWAMAITAVWPGEALSEGTLIWILMMFRYWNYVQITVCPQQTPCANISAPGHPRSQVNDWFCNCIIGSTALGSGEERSWAVNWSLPGGELYEMAWEDTGQTWHT